MTPVTLSLKQSETRRHSSGIPSRSNSSTRDPGLVVDLPIHSDTFPPPIASSVDVSEEDEEGSPFRVCLAGRAGRGGRRDRAEVEPKGKRRRNESRSRIVVVVHPIMRLARQRFSMPQIIPFSLYMGGSHYRAEQGRWHEGGGTREG